MGAYQRSLNVVNLEGETTARKARQHIRREPGEEQQSQVRLLSVNFKRTKSA